MRLEIAALTGLPEVRPGDDLASLIRGAGETFDQAVVVAIAQKIVSKAEGAIIDLREMRPSEIAQSWASQWNKDAANTLLDITTYC